MDTDSDLPGIGFERVVAEIYRQLGSEAAVTHDEKIIDRLGQLRQFDVVIRGKFAGQDALAVVECKDTARHVGLEEVESFITKSCDINANFKLICSRRGFTENAIKKARHYGVQLISLLSEKDGDLGVLIGHFWYGTIYRWRQLQLQLIGAGIELPAFELDDVTHGGVPIISWFKNYLTIHHAREEQTGWCVSMGEIFDRPKKLEIGGIEYLVEKISFAAERVCEHRRRMVMVRGKGTYNWLEGAATFMPGSTYVSDAVDTDASSWSEWNGVDEQKNGLVRMHLTWYVDDFPLDAAADQLRELFGNFEDAALPPFSAT